MTESGRFDHDVAVIGGGPAGSTAAALLAAAGRRVVLFEKERFPRFHIGESLLPFNSELLRRLGVHDELRGCFIEKWGAQLLSSDGSVARRISFAETLVAGDASAFHVLRSRFDELLLRNAERRGAEIHEGTAVVDAAFSSRDGWRLTARDASDRKWELGARVLLDASGQDAFVASRRQLRKMTPHLRKAAVYAHYEGVTRAGGREGGDIVLVFLKDGWFWLIPLPEGRTSVGLVLEGSRLRTLSLPPDRLLEQAVRRCPATWARVGNARRVSEVRTASDYSYRCRRVAGDGYLLLGDAAAFIDPIFSTGVWLAMSSAEMAADTVHRILDRPHPVAGIPRSAAAAYARKVRRHVSTYMRIVSRFYEPGFMDVFLQPTDRLQIRQAVTTLLAGVFDPPAGIRLRLALFYLAARAQRRLPLTPAVPLLRVLEESAP